MLAKARTYRCLRPMLPRRQGMADADPGQSPAEADYIQRWTPLGAQAPRRATVKRPAENA
jgi:hypothetical protein